MLIIKHIASRDYDKKKTNVNQHVRLERSNDERCTERKWKITNDGTSSDHPADVAQQNLFLIFA